MNLLVESLLRRVVSVENLFTHGGGFCTASLVASVPKDCILPVNLEYTLCTLSILQINEPLTDSTAWGTAPPNPTASDGISILFPVVSALQVSTYRLECSSVMLERKYLQLPQ